MLTRHIKYCVLKCKACGVVFNVRRFLSHKPVMADEIVRLLNPQDGQTFIDMTFGSGGHSSKLLDTNRNIRIVAVDRDPVAISRAYELSAKIANKSSKFNLNQSVIPIHGKFSTVIQQIHLSGIPYGTVDGIIFDLGASSLQFDDPNRGFSVSLDGALDMRMDSSNPYDITAEDVLNNMSLESLAQLIRIYGEERRSRKLSSAIVDARTLLGRIKTTRELCRVVESVSPPEIDSLGRFAHGATKLFQALRIFVNNELNELNYGLKKVWDFLKPTRGMNLNSKSVEPTIDGPHGGVIAVLTFHSLEDIIVKRHFSGDDVEQPNFKHLTQHDRIRTNSVPAEKFEELLTYKKWRPLNKHVVKPTDEEIAANPRSRSAKLRAAIRID